MSLTENIATILRGNFKPVIIYINNLASIAVIIKYIGFEFFNMKRYIK